MITKPLKGSVFVDKATANDIDKVEYQGKKYDSYVEIWWEPTFYKNDEYKLCRDQFNNTGRLSYDLYYDRKTGLMLYRNQKYAKEQKMPCTIKFLYGALYSSRRGEGTIIPVSDAIDILKAHPEFFDHSNNKPASVSFGRMRDYDDMGKVLREYYSGYEGDDSLEGIY